MPNRDTYEADVFISYKRGSPALDFVRVLRPVLQTALGAHILHPRVFLDEHSALNGADPRTLCRMVQRSVCLIGVWVPSYEDSSWCVAEWRTMRERQLQGYCGALEIVFPIAFCVPSGRVVKVVDDTPIVKPVADVTGRRDIRTPNSRQPSRNFKLFAEDIAAELAAPILAAPPWRNDFPLVEPGPTPVPPPLPLPSRQPLAP